MEKNITAHEYKICRFERQKLNGHNSFLIFFTGLSGSGKSTIANALEERLNHSKIHTYVLDGDNVRRGINQNLGFSPEDRSENNRRIGEISKLFIDAGLVVMAAFVAPYQKDRNFIKETVNPDNFVEVFVNTSLEVCEERDIKGLYKKARAGVIKNMTGISAPYEAPENPDVEVSHLNSIEESVDIIFQAIKNKLDLKKSINE
ncbi:adenylyl-sulfate kinase [Tamlana haliotis]|uniref:Adenylyl-sulfate kinase n=1 Tax=Pseudotamlana haliotis TaxID=2614804 RepID=A0A6N6MI70_9FLAO|nr:adenylyl-sulfate kinase [Tamlana haliotis]KAB1067867.1 adenylyl-sulfate kinase [Tamlana haliotis]